MPIFETMFVRPLEQKSNRVRFVIEAVHLFFSKRHIKSGFTCAHRIGDEMMPFGSKIRP
jgi:hypothetical protein